MNDPRSREDVQRAWFIGDDGAELPAVEQVGGKALNLMRMARLGLPVPPGFVLGTALCRQSLEQPDAIAAVIDDLIAGPVEQLERGSGLRFGDGRRPLLVSVRSGAARSMPGMLETVLNVGLNESTVSGLIRSTGNPRLAWDSYRRLIQNYAEVVDGCRQEPFGERLRQVLEERGLESEAEFDTPTLRRLTQDFLDLYRALTGEPFPQDPLRQLNAAIRAVFASWQSPRAVEYRRLNHLEALSGTAATVQQMVFGNAGGTSGSGVGFSRDPATGEKRLYIDFSFNAQGEDVVAGRHADAGRAELEELLPTVHAEVAQLARTLEQTFRDLQDFEFTVQGGRLYVLQTRAGKRTPLAALNVAVDLVDEGLIEPREVAARLAGLDLDAIEETRFVAGAGSVEALARAVPASVGVACGRIAFSTARARMLVDGGDEVILLRHDAATEDIEGLAVSAGLLTAAGARTSHAAVVARELGKVCLVACRELEIAPDNASARLNGKPLHEGDYLALDGNSGEVFAARREIVRAAPAAKIARVRTWLAAG